MTISEIYSQYKITSGLQMHMLRVAGVAKYICQSMDSDVDERSIVTACLLHDMGNIIKFKMTVRPHDFLPEGVVYWKKVQDEYITKYGNDENIATEIILNELGVSKKVLDIYSHIGFGRAPIVLEIDDFNFKIANYADQRVGPDSVMSMLDRLQEGRKRYFANKGDVADPVFFDNNVRRLEMIEEQVFAKSRLNPSDITDLAIIGIIDDLRVFEI